MKIHTISNKMKNHKHQHIFGTVKIGERGQLVIPKEARDIFNINPGDSVLVLGDEKKGGLAIIKTNAIKDTAFKILGGLMGVQNHNQEDKK